MSVLGSEELQQGISALLEQQRGTNELLRALLARGYVTEDQVRAMVQEELERRWSEQARVVGVIEEPAQQNTLGNDVIRGLLSVALPIFGAVLMKLLLGGNSPPQFPGMEGFKS